MHEGAGEGAVAVIDNVTRGAVLVGHNMACRFSFAYIAIMAGQAVAGISARMVKQRTGKADGRMAVGTILVVRCRRDVINEFADADPVIVTRGTVVDDAGMIIGAGAESARCMANTAILAGRHVSIESGCGRHAARRAGAIRHMAGDATVIHNARMVDTESRAEAQGVVAETAIGAGCRVRRHCGAFPACVNTVGIIVAGFT